MPKYGKVSRARLSTFHEDGQRLMNEVIKYVDISAAECHRSTDRQFELFKKGRKDFKNGKGWVIVDKNKVVTYIDGHTKKGKHNHFPSLAVDFVPWVPGIGADWNNKDRFQNIAFMIRGIALGMGIKVRLGADWDGDYFTNDQRLHDIPHIELVSRLIDGEWVDYD